MPGNRLSNIVWECTAKLKKLRFVLSEIGYRSDHLEDIASVKDALDVSKFED